MLCLSTLHDVEYLNFMERGKKFVFDTTTVFLRQLCFLSCDSIVSSILL